MAAVSALNARRLLGNLRKVLALELVCAAQALDFQSPADAAGPARELHAAVRSLIPFADTDRPLDIAPVVELI